MATIQRKGSGGQLGGAVGGGSLPLIVSQNSFGIVPSSRLPIASKFNDGVMSRAQVEQLSQTVALEDVSLTVDPINGNDGSGNGSPAAPFKTLEKAVAQYTTHMKSYIINLLSDVAITAKTLFMSIAQGPASVPPIINCAFKSLYGNLVCSASSANKSTYTVGVKPAALRTATGCSVIAGAPAGCMRILVAGYVAADIGSLVQVAGSGNAGNNATMFTIQGVNPGVSIDVINKKAVVTDAGPLTVTDSLVGCRLRCVSGANAGQSREIASNGTTTFVANTPFLNAIIATDTFVVEDQTKVKFSGALTFSGQFVGFVGMHLFSTTPNAGAIGPLGFDSEQCLFQGCKVSLATADGLDASSINFVDGAQCFAGFFGAPQLRNWGNDTSGLFTVNQRGSGLFVHNMGDAGGVGQGLEFNQGSRANGFFILGHGYFTFENASANLKTPVCERVTALAQGACEIITTAQVATYPGVWNEQYVNDAAGAILAFDGSCSGSIDGLGINKSTGYGVSISRQSNVTLNKLTGTNNACGMRVDRSSYIRIDTGGAGNTTLTGTNDSELGHQTPPLYATYATIRTTDGNGVKGTQDIYGNRIEAN